MENESISFEGSHIEVTTTKPANAILSQIKEDHLYAKQACKGNISKEKTKPANAILLPTGKDHLYAGPACEENISEEKTVKLDKEINSSEESPKLNNNAKNFSRNEKDKEKVLDKIKRNSVPEKNQGLNFNPFVIQNRPMYPRKISEDKCEKQNSGKLERKTHLSSKSSEKDNSLKVEIVKTLQGTKRTIGKDLKRNDNISEDSSDESTNFGPSKLQHRRSSWKIKNESETKLIFKCETKTHSSSKSLEKEYFMKEHANTLPKTNKTKRKDFKSKDRFSGSSSDESAIPGSSKILHRRSSWKIKNKSETKLIFKCETKTHSSSESLKNEYSVKEHANTLPKMNKTKRKDFKSKDTFSGSSDSSAIVDSSANQLEHLHLRKTSSAKSVSSDIREKFHKRKDKGEKGGIKKLLTTSEEGACAPSFSKSVSIGMREQVDNPKTTEKGETENKKPLRTSKTDNTANADGKEPTYEGSNENIADQSISIVPAENKVGSKRLSDPSNALKENRPFK